MGDSAVLGIDIGGTHIRKGLIDTDYNLHDFSLTKSQPVLDTADPLARLEDLVRSSVAETDHEIAAVSIGFPSTIDAARKVVLSTPNIASLQNLPVVEKLSSRLNLPVFINRDVNFIMLSDLEDLKDNIKPASACGFYIGTGIGSSIYLDGRLLTGAHGTAAELGHIHVPGFKASCGCGGTGCIELIAGGMALERIRQEHFADTFIGDLFTRHQNKPQLRRYIQDLAAAVACQIIIIDPEVSILGGGVIQMADFPRAFFEECLYSYARRPCPPGSLRLIYVKDSQYSGVRGAGIYAFKRLADPHYL